MNKIIGSIAIIIILAQPITSNCLYKQKTIAINIVQEYLFLSTEKENEEEHTLEDLADNMNAITKLINTKNQVVANIQHSMNEKSIKKDTMNDIQISKFQEFMKITNDNNKFLQRAITTIESKKDLKIMQQAILKNKIDYTTVTNEINSVYDSQNLAMESLASIIDSGNSLLNLL